MVELILSHNDEFSHVLLKNPARGFSHIRAPVTTTENSKQAFATKGHEGMSTAALGDIFANKMAQFKQGQGNTTVAGAQVFMPPEPKIDRAVAISLAIRPVVKDWEDLVATLDRYQALDESGLYRQLLLKTVRDLYDQGHGSELVTAAELAKSLASKEAPSHYFARSISKRAGRWATVTLEMVRKTWEARQNAQMVMEKLKLDEKITGYVLSLAWKFKGSLTRFLSMATEQGYGIKNPAGYFFGIIKNIQEAKAAT